MNTSDSVIDSLILDLLEWLAKGDRSYEEVMEAWRTSCPRLPVWEDANDSRTYYENSSAWALRCSDYIGGTRSS